MMDNHGIGEYTEKKARAISVPLRTQERAEALEGLGVNVVEKIGSQLNVRYPFRIKGLSKKRYKNVIETPVVVNNSIASIAAGTLFTACKEKSVPVSFDDLRDASSWYEDSNERGKYSSLRIYDSDKLTDNSKEYANFGSFMTDEESIRSAYNQIRRQLNLSYTPIPPEKFVKRYCRELDATSSFRTIAQVTREKSQKTVYSGKPPSTFAAGAIWFTAEFVDHDHREDGERISLNDIASVSSKSVSAIGKTAKEIENKIDAFDLGKSGPTLDP